MAIKMPSPKLVEKTAEAFIGAAAKPAPSSSSKAAVNMRMDNELLARIDADARNVGISRSAWLHVAAFEKLDRK
jgi:hypothetical protein